MAEVTGSSPTRERGHIGKVVAALKAEVPPYTPEEVCAFGARFHELVPQIQLSPKEV